MIGSTGGETELINCCSLVNLYGSEHVGGFIGFNDVRSNLNIVNCYNAGEVSGGSYRSASGIIGCSYNTGTRNIINTCSLGKLIQDRLGYSYNFYYAYGGATVNLSNCYYLDTIINEKTTINQGSTLFSKGDNTIINNLNDYVENHKNDYISRGITLYSWKLDNNGLPIFDK